MWSIGSLSTKVFRKSAKSMMATSEEGGGEGDDSIQNLPEATPEIENISATTTTLNLTVTNPLHQDLEHHVDSLGSSMEVALSFTDMKTNLETKIQRLQAECQNLKCQNTGLIAQNSQLRNRFVKISKEVPAKSFVKFPELPTEIRLKIWNFAEPGPRMIELLRSKWQGSIQYNCQRNRHPAILHVCREARNEVLRRHPLCIEPAFGIPRFFNHEQDIIYMDCETMREILRYANGAERWPGWKSLDPKMQKAGFLPSQLRFLAISTSTWTYIQVGRFPDSLDKLEELILIDMGELTQLPFPFKTVPIRDNEYVAWGATVSEEHRKVLAATYKDQVSYQLQKYSHDRPGNPFRGRDRAIPRVRLEKLASVECGSQEFRLSAATITGEEWHRSDFRWITGF